MVLMKSIFLAPIFLLTSCGSPLAYQAIEEITEDAIDIMISLDAVNKKKDVSVEIKSPEQH